MARVRIVRIVLPVVAFCALLAVLMFGRPMAPPNFGPAQAIAATPTPTPKPATFSSSCQGTLKGLPFSKVASTLVNTTTFSFNGTETDVENGTPVVFSFTGTFGAGPGPVPGATFTTTQTACTSCATSPCSGISGCTPLVGHAELATQHFSGVTEEAMTEASFESNETVLKDRTVVCRSSKAP